MKWGIMLTTAQDLFREKKYKKCFLQLIKISNQASHQVEYLELLYKVQIQLQDQSAAVKILSVLIEKSGRVDYGLEKMRLLMSLQRHNEALDIGLSLQGQNLNVVERKKLFEYLIDIYIVFSDFEGLEELLNHYHAEFADEAISLFAWGLLYIQDEQANDAILCLRQALYANPLLDRAWVSLALMHYKMGDAELALANIERALDINDQNPVAIKCFAIWKEELGEYNLASRKVSEYLQKNSFDHDLIKKAIDLFKKIGQPEIAFLEEIKLRYYFGNI